MLLSIEHIEMMDEQELIESIKSGEFYKYIAAIREEAETHFYDCPVFYDYTPVKVGMDALCGDKVRKITSIEYLDGFDRAIKFEGGYVLCDTIFHRLERYPGEIDRYVNEKLKEGTEENA